MPQLAIPLRLVLLGKPKSPAIDKVLLLLGKDAVFERIKLSLENNIYYMRKFIGRSFVVTSFGESHGPAIGCVVDGCPPNLPISEKEIQNYLDLRRPGTSRHVTQRKESDSVKIGVFQGLTTGAQYY